MTEEAHTWHVEPVEGHTDEFVCVDEQNHHTRKHFYGRAFAKTYAEQLNALNGT